VSWSLPALVAVLAVTACAGGAQSPDVAAPDTGPEATDLPEAGPELPDVVPDLPPEAAWPIPPPGPGFHRAGTAIRDEQGRSLILHGASVSNSAKYTPGYLPWHGEGDFHSLAAQGFNVVRLLTFWAAIMPQPDVVDAAYLDAYAERVEWAAKAGLLVVVDMHQDIFGVGFGEDGAPRWACDEASYAAFQPTTPWYMNYLDPLVQACYDRLWTDDALFQRYVDAWVAVARRVKGNPAVLGFDLFNEPNWGTMEVDAWVETRYQPRMTQIAAALRAEVPDRLTFLQGTQLSSIKHQDPFVPFADPRVVFAPHYYQIEVHDGAPYVRDVMLPDMEETLDSIAGMSVLLGDVPLWMGEMGGPWEAPGFEVFIQDLLSSLARRGWGFAMYADDLGGGFAIRTAPDDWREGYVRRLGHAYARRVPGPLLEQAMDFATWTYAARFAWVYDAPLELWLGRNPEGTPAAVVTLAPEVGLGPALHCGARDEALPGVVTCPVEGERPAFGATYALSIGPG
jgi:endoglycosylceramidase